MYIAAILLRSIAEQSVHSGATKPVAQRQRLL